MNATPRMAEQVSAASIEAAGAVAGLISLELGRASIPGLADRVLAGFHEADMRVLGNRPAGAITSLADLKLILAARLRHLIDLLDGPPEAAAKEAR